MKKNDHIDASGERLLEAIPYEMDRFRAAIGNRRFEPALEHEYRLFNWQQNAPRARIATAIYLGLVLLVTLLNGRGINISVPDEAFRQIQILRLAVSTPALIAILLASICLLCQRYYQYIVGTAVVVHGCSVMSISAIAVSSGLPELQMGDILIIVYSGLFLGLLFRTALISTGAIIAAFFAFNILLGASFAEIVFPSTILMATAWMVVASSGRIESLSRSGFIETRLLNQMAERDGLTGLYNRRKFDEQVALLWHQARREHQHLQILLIDIDCFKRYNDIYGHQAGDDCIRRVSRIIARSARRPMDFCARYGGEEFVLVCYGSTPGESLEGISERIREQVMIESIPHENSDVAPVVTVSIGSSVGDPHSGRSLKSLIQKADEALYRAKQSGRNRVVHKSLSQHSDPADVSDTFKIPLAG